MFILHLYYYSLIIYMLSKLIYKTPSRFIELKVLDSRLIFCDFGLYL